MADATTEEGTRRARRSSRPVLPAVVLVAGLLTTAFATFAFLRAIRARDAERFSNAVEATEDRVRGRIEAYSELLRAARAFVTADPGVRESDFRAFVDGLDLRARYPGVPAIGLIIALPKEGGARVLAELRARSDAPIEPLPAGGGDDRTVVAWAEPNAPQSRTARGFDMTTVPERREALFRARDTAEPALSGPLVLVSSARAAPEAGFLLCVPIYAPGANPTDAPSRRAALLGWVYAPLRANDLLRGLFGSEHSPRITLSVFDGDALDEAHALHRTDTPSDDPRYLARFTQTTRLDFGGREWTLRFRTRPAFEETPSEQTVIMAGVLGVALTLALFAATRAQRDAREAAEASERRMRLLAETSAALGDSLEATEAAAALAKTAVPEFAALCTVDLAADDGTLIRAHVAHDGSLSRELEERLAAGPPGDERHPLHRAFALGRTQYEPRFADHLSVIAGDEARKSAHVALGARSALFIALVARGRTLGVVSFIGRRPYDDDDRALAAELVRRAAFAIDNARLYRETRDAVRSRNVFLSIASHELKTPLTSLKLHAQRLVRRARTPDLPPLPVADVAERAQAMDLQATRLNQLVDELLDVSRIAAGRMRFNREPVDLAHLTRDVLDRFGSPLVTSSGVESLVGDWDRLRLDQVVTNLVSNALKYGEGKPVAVRVEPAGERARLTVEDHGIGIAREHQARVFDRFERFVSERHHGGFGLGLWITRQIVEGLGGTITVHSELGHGSTFVVELPTSAPAPREASPGGA